MYRYRLPSRLRESKALAASPSKILLGYQVIGNAAADGKEKQEMLSLNKAEDQGVFEIDGTVLSIPAVEEQLALLNHSVVDAILFQFFLIFELEE